MNLKLCPEPQSKISAVLNKPKAASGMEQQDASKVASGMEQQAESKVASGMEQQVV